MFIKNHNSIVCTRIVQMFEFRRVENDLCLMMMNSKVESDKCMKKVLCSKDITKNAATKPLSSINKLLQFGGLNLHVFNSLISRSGSFSVTYKVRIDQVFSYFR